MKYIITETQFKLISEDSDKSSFFERLINDILEDAKSDCNNQYFVEYNEYLCSQVTLINSITVFESEVGGTIQGETFFRVRVIINGESGHDSEYWDFLTFYVAPRLYGTTGLKFFFQYKVNPE